LSDQTKKAEVAGIMSALMTLGMIIGPIFVGGIYTYNPHLPFVVSGIIMFVAFLVMWWNEKKTKEAGYHHKDTEPVEVIA
jgi:MFS family permease